MTNTAPGEDPSWSCSTVLEKLYEFLDGELTPDVDEQIRAHLAICQHCFPHFEHERVFLRFIEKRALIVRAPPALRRRILQQLLEEEVARRDK